MEGWDGLSFGYLLSKFSKVVWFTPYKRALVVFIFVLNNNNNKGKGKVYMFMMNMI